MRKKLLIAAALILVLIVGWLIFRLTTFRIVTTTPKNNSTDISLDTKITIQLSKNIETANIELSITPEQIFKTSVENKTLTINTGLLPNTNYAIDIVKITSLNGKTLSNKKLSFKTGVTSADVVQKKESIKKILPFTANNFSVDYIIKDNQYTVSIYSEPIEKIRLEALLFLADYLITEETDNIDFYVAPNVSGNPGP